CSTTRCRRRRSVVNGRGPGVPSDASAWMPRPMAVGKIQDAEEAVAQMREEQARSEREARRAELRRPPVAETAEKLHSVITAPLSAVRVMANMRNGRLADLQ